MAKKIIDSCCACGKVGHRAYTWGHKDYAGGQYVCPAWKQWGKTGTRLENGHCSECGAAGFVYANGMHVSEDGIRGYRCMTCGTIKPER